MYKCAECLKPMSKSEAVIDHIVPLMRGGTNDPSNLRLVHVTCNKMRKRGWFSRQWLRFRRWLDSFTPCYKESLGYTCQHRVYKNGTKECGEYPNE